MIFFGDGKWHKNCVAGAKTGGGIIDNIKQNSLLPNEGVYSKYYFIFCLHLLFIGNCIQYIFGIEYARIMHIKCTFYASQMRIIRVEKPFFTNALYMHKMRFKNAHFGVPYATHFIMILCVSIMRITRFNETVFMRFQMRIFVHWERPICVWFCAK